MKKHIVFIFIGCVLSILTFVFDWKNIYPLTIWCFYSSLPILIVGVVLWIVYFKNKTGRFPSLDRLIHKEREKHSGKSATHVTMFSLLIDNVFKFWTFVVIAVMILVHVLSFSLNKSEVFMTAKEHLDTNIEIESQIGKIKNYGIVPAFRTFYSETTQQKNAEINTKLVGEKGIVKVKIKLIQKLDWQVDTVLFN